MKTIINSVLLIVLLTLFFAACKKKSAGLTTAEKVQGTWQLQSDIYHQHVGGVDYSDTTWEMVLPLNLGVIIRLILISMGKKTLQYILYREIRRLS